MNKIRQRYSYSFKCFLLQHLGILYHVLCLIYNSTDVSIVSLYHSDLLSRFIHLTGFCYFRLVSQILSPTWLAAAFPQTGWLQDPDNFFYKTLAGISSGYVQTIFYMVLPQIFKLLSLFEGSSTSKAKAEENATRFYWYFMLVTAFTGSSLANMFLNGLAEGTIDSFIAHRFSLF